MWRYPTKPSKTKSIGYFASSFHMHRQNWTIRIWMMECTVLAGLLAACKLATGFPYIAILAGIAWWLGAFLSPKNCSWIGAIVGLGLLTNPPFSPTGTVVAIEIVIGVWAAFAYLPILHREALGYFGGSQKTPDHEIEN
jgi:hypothetical protein